jgi:hypothetical protein
MYVHTHLELYRLRKFVPHVHDIIIIFCLILDLCHGPVPFHESIHVLIFLT